MSFEDNLYKMRFILPTKELLVENGYEVNINWTGIDTTPNSVQFLKNAIGDMSFADYMDSIKDTIVDIPSGMETGSAERFNLAVNYFVPNAASTDYYTMNYLFFKNTDSMQNYDVIYSLLMVQAFPDNLNHLIGLKTNLSKTHLFGNKKFLPSVEQIQNYGEVSSWLLSEGLVIPVSTIWVVSQEWDKDKFVQLMIKDSVTYEKLNQLAFTGFGTVAEMLDFIENGYKLLPEAWLKDILEASGYYD